MMHLSALLPAGVRLGDAITPDVIERIVRTERAACVAVCQGLYPHEGYHPALRRGADRCAIAIQMRGSVIETSSRECAPVSAC